MTGGTPFTELSGTVNFADGLASNDDLLLTSPVLNFGGRGSVNLTSLWVDYRGVVRLTGSCAARVGRSFRELRGYEIPVHISGPASQPKVEANLASLIPAFAGRGGRQAQPSQSHAVARRQHPPALPTEEQVIRGLLERLLK